jgi:arsenite oxidase small subunit
MRQARRRAPAGFFCQISGHGGRCRGNRGAAGQQPVPRRLSRWSTYPTNKLANLRDLKVNEPLDITYPDGDSPGVLLKLGSRVEGGAGPDGDVVAFSTLCPHKGFPLNYGSGDKTLSCSGHYSRFDVEKGGLQIFGHATQNLPQFRLVVDQQGDIHTVGVDELIYGRLSNVLSA